MSNKEVYIKLCAEQQLVVPVFMQPWWLDAVCNNWDVAIARKGANVSGAWAYCIKSNELNNPLLTPYLGPHVFYPHNIKENNRDAFEHEAVTELIKQLPEVKTWDLAIEPGIKQAGIFKSYKLQPQAQQTFWVGLEAGEDELLANMSESVRDDILKAQKELVVTDNPEMLGKFINSPDTSGTQKYALDNFQQVVNISLANNTGALWTATKGNECMAMAWHIWDGAKSYYLKGGKSNYPEGKAAIVLLLWHTMKEAKRMGHTTLDLVGGMEQDTEHFYRSIGAERKLYMVLHKK